MTLINLATNEVFGPPSNHPQYQCDIFVLMPFADEFTPIYEDHLTAVAGGLGYSIKRGDDFFSKKSIMVDVWSAIVNAKIIIIDCTGRNPNVFYELGMAHALDKPSILITQNMEDIPFDIRHLRIIPYKLTPRGMKQFEKSLEEAIEALLSDTNYFENLKNNPSDLPADKDDQLRIVEKVLAERDFETFDAILPYIQGIKVTVAKKLIELNDLRRTADITRMIEGSSSLKTVGEALFDAGCSEDPIMQDILKRMVNNTERRAFARYIYQRNGEDSTLFRDIVEGFTTGAEVKNLAIYFINDHRLDSPAFDYIVENLTRKKNTSQLKNLAIAFIDRKLADKVQFYRVVNVLNEASPESAKSVISYWVENARQSAEEGLNKGIITSASLAEYMKALLS